MPRIAGVNLPDNKPIEISLTYLFGIGRSNAKVILERANINCHLRAGKLTDEQLSKISAVIEKDFVVEGHLKRQLHENISRLVRIGCYRGTRHKIGLPVRGQRTRSNARTRKGPRKTIAGKKKAPAAK